MTLDDIRPTLGATYRRRDTGLRGAVLTWRLCQPRLAVLLMEDGSVWRGTPDEFWALFIHEDIFDVCSN